MIKKVEVLANIAIIITAFTLCSVLIKNYLLSTNKQTANAAAASTRSSAGAPIRLGLEAGTKISLPGIDGNGNRTLLLALSKTCRFCTESSSFYKRLVQAKGSTRLVVFMPQPAEEGRAYLNKLGVSVDEVKQLPLERIGVEGTPTLVLIDASGVVRNSWLGFLPPEDELAVLQALKEN